MMPTNVFQMDLAGRVRPLRSLLLRLGLPVLLAMPFALTAMPPKAKSAGMVMLLLFVAFFGSAVAAVRRRTDGITERLRTLPIPRWLVATDLLLAGAAMDFAQAAGPVAMFLAAGASNLGPAALVTIAGLLAAVVTLLNALGMALAASMKGNPEVHLAGALAVGLIATVSGLFPLPARLAGVIGPTLPYNPVSLLAEALARSVEGTFAVSASHVAAATAVLAVIFAAMLIRALGLAGPKGR